MVTHTEQKLLRRLIATHGSAAAVAQALDVHVTVLQQWLTGDGLIPKRCLLKAIDLFLLGLEMPAVNAAAGEGKAGRK